MPDYRVTTERQVEAANPQEAAAIVACMAPDEWVVYGDDYRQVTVVTPQETAEIQERWKPKPTDIVTIKDAAGEMIATYPVGDMSNNDVFGAGVEIQGCYFGEAADVWPQLQVIKIDPGRALGRAP